MNLLIISLGICSVIMQFVLQRELQITFQANELTLGLIFSCWLAGTSLGSFCGRFHLGQEQKNLLEKTSHQNKKTLSLILLFSICWFYISLFLSRALKNYLHVGTYGILSTQQILVIAAAAVIPISFCLGMSFVVASAAINKPVKVYTLESLGAFCAGMLSLILPDHFNSAQIIFGVSLLILFSSTVILFKPKLIRLTLLLAGILIIFLSSGRQLEKFQDTTNRLRYKPQELIANQDTIYGNIAVTRYGLTYSLYENGRLYFTTEDTQGLEETANLLLLSHPQPKKILLIGSGVSGIISEILKFPVEAVDYVELDPKIIDLSLSCIPDVKDFKLENEKVKIYYQDARNYTTHTNSKYDLIILNTGDPLSFMLNRLYTEEFFRIAQIHLRESGIFCLAISSKEDILKGEILKYNTSIYKSAKNTFNSVEIIPGERMILICSQDPVLRINSSLLEKRFDQRKIFSLYFSRQHIKPKLERQQYVKSCLEAGLKKTRENLDYKPYAYFYCLSVWEKSSRIGPYRSLTSLPRMRLLFLIGLGFIILLLLKKNALKTAIFTTGLTTISLEIIASFIFQINFGYLYYRLGAIIGCFMLGAALGGLSSLHKIKNAWIEKNILIFTETGLGVICLTAPFLLRGMPSIYFFMVIFIGFLAGYEFGVFCRKQKVSAVYSLDTFGACIGSLSIGTIFVPVFGIYNTCLSLGLIKFIGLLFLRKQTR